MDNAGVEFLIELVDSALAGKCDILFNSQPLNAVHLVRAFQYVLCPCRTLIADALLLMAMMQTDPLQLCAATPQTTYALRL